VAHESFLIAFFALGVGGNRMWEGGSSHPPSHPPRGGGSTMVPAREPASTEPGRKRAVRRTRESAFCARRPVSRASPRRARAA
jgi:hypothetical protein